SQKHGQQLVLATADQRTATELPTKGRRSIAGYTEGRPYRFEPGAIGSPNGAPKLSKGSNNFDGSQQIHKSF
ncbi:MAG TPA: hypothetical protein VN345_14065, partial [Blastocatellia bacterium]|nr:hypothetical protein [Blastocatellia bacterium]